MSAIDGILQEGIDAALKNVPGGELIQKYLGEAIALIKGRAYTIGKYKLREKYYQYVKGTPTGDWRTGDDKDVNIAIDFFTNGFAVPITTIEDLDFLEAGDIASYYARDPAYVKAPQAAVERAAMLKQRYYPYSAARWDFSLSAQIPLVGYESMQQAAATTGGQTPGAGYPGQTPGATYPVGTPTPDQLKKPPTIAGVSWYWVLGPVGILLAGVIAIFKVMGKKGKY